MLAPDHERSLKRRASLKKKLLLSVAAAVVCFVVAETIASILYQLSIIDPHVIWIVESNAELSFDPVIGYKLPNTPLRFACMTSDGAVESVGKMRGNNYGLPDNDAFSPRRKEASEKRFVILGDSFTAAQFLEKNWPEAAEELLGGSGPEAVRLLNFSIDGGGIVNWHSMLVRLIEAEKFEIDAIVFAVAVDDLRRGFAMWDSAVSEVGETAQNVRFGSYPQWDLTLLADDYDYSLRSLPDTKESALPYYSSVPEFYFVPPGEFDKILQNQQRPPQHRPWTFYLTNKCRRGLQSLFSPPEKPVTADQTVTFEPPRIRIIQEIRQSVERIGVPALVVHIPEGQSLLRNGTPYFPYSLAEAQEFAELLEVEFLDGHKAFGELDADAYERYWLPRDPHWAQAGSDRFAAFMAAELSRWP